MIDPFKRTITEEQLLAKGKTYEIFSEELKALLGTRELGFSRLGHDIQLIYDDIGLYREGQKFFDLQGFPETLSGKFLLTGLDETGESVSLPERISVELVTSQVTWRNIKFVDMEQQESRVQTPFGPALQLRLRPKFEELQ